MRHTARMFQCSLPAHARREAELWRRGVGGFKRRAQSMRAVWNILTAASVEGCVEERC